jgi:virginiamycin B lyase
MRLRDTVLICVAIAGLLLAGGFASRTATRTPAVATLQVKIREWNVPTKGAHPHDPAVAPDGSLWFTEQMVSKLGRLDPATGEFKEYALKGQNDGPHGLVADRDGNIWYTGNFAAHIGKLDPRSGEVRQYKMPNEKAEDPHTAAFDAQGKLWFTVQVGNMVGQLDPKTGKIELKQVATKEARPYGIQINSKGVPFFCEFGTNKMAKIEPTTMEITEYPLDDGWRSRRTTRCTSRTIRAGGSGVLIRVQAAPRCGHRRGEADRIRMELPSRRTGWCGTASRA